MGHLIFLRSTFDWDISFSLPSSFKSKPWQIQTIHLHPRLVAETHYAQQMQCDIYRDYRAATPPDADPPLMQQQDEEAEVHFEPVIKLTEQVETKTMEEDEDPIFKMYVFALPLVCNSH